ncbi:MAG: acyl-CoA dehydrogenase, partial [Syntrophomonadaceae bacterium]|nr:acyl-CoA dehydrogenase [Syntrophomonadaceae bacterium]
VPSDAPGITMKPLNKLGWRGIDNCEVWLDNVEFEEEDLLGKEGYGLMNLVKNFEIESLLMAASVLGMAECAFEDAARHANQRVQFGKRIGEFQQIQPKIVEMKIKIENMRARVYTCAWEKDHGLSVQISSALAKLYCGQAANEVIDDAVQILGGLGWMEDTRVARLWRDARVFRIGGGTDQVMVHIAGRALLKQYR